MRSISEDRRPLPELWSIDVGCKVSVWVRHQTQILHDASSSDSVEGREVVQRIGPSQGAIYGSTKCPPRDATFRESGALGYRKFFSGYKVLFVGFKSFLLTQI